MAVINHAKREINVKIVYYGHAGAGKRASLRYIYDRIKPSLRGELKTVPASGDSLFFFDFSPFEVPQFGGYRVRFHMYCLTGKVSNPAAWKMTLKGADGVVIVADTASETLPASRESISRLREFLAAYGVGLHDLPCVLQLSGADTPAQSAADLDLPDLRSCHANPVSGEGVLEVLSLLSRDVMLRVGRDQALRAVEHPVTAQEADMDATPATLSREFEAHSLYLAESARAIAEELFQSAEEQVGDAAGVQGGQVALSGEPALSAGGSVRIPLKITLGGATRRLVVSIAVEEG